MARPGSRFERNAVLLLDIENLVGGHGNDYVPIDLLAFINSVRRFYSNFISEFAFSRAYANWSDHIFDKMRRTVHQADVDPIQIFRMTDEYVKNAADAEMMVDAISIAYERPELDVFILATADGAFAAAAMKLHELGRTVLGVRTSTAKQSKYLIESCDLYACFDPRLSTIVGEAAVGPSFAVSLDGESPILAAVSVGAKMQIEAHIAQDERSTDGEAPELVSIAKPILMLRSIIQELAEEHVSENGDDVELAVGRIAERFAKLAGKAWRLSSVDAGLVNVKDEPFALTAILKALAFGGYIEGSYLVFPLSRYESLWMPPVGVDVLDRVWPLFRDLAAATPADASRAARSVQTRLELLGIAGLLSLAESIVQRVAGPIGADTISGRGAGHD